MSPDIMDEGPSHDLWRERLAQWMFKHDIATGDAETFGDLLEAIEKHIETLKEEGEVLPE